MRNRTRMIATAATLSAALAAGSAAAVASTTAATPGAATKTRSASQEPAGAKAAGAKSARERQAHAAITAAVAQALHVSAARVGAALQPLFAAGRADSSSPIVAAAARSLGVSTQQLYAALVHAKLSLAGTYGRQSRGGAKAAGSKPAAERQGHAAMTAAVAQALHVSAARVSAALRPLFAAGRSDTSSPEFAAAARSLGVSTHQLLAALMHAKQSLAPGS